MSQTIEVSKEGIKLSYLRFISDSTPGYIVLFLLGSAYYNKVPLPIVGDAWLALIPPSVGGEVKILILVMAFLLATAIGLTLNAFGWFTLGFLQIRLVGLWKVIPAVLIVTPTRRAMCHADVANFIDEKTIPFQCLLNLYERSQYFEQLLTTGFPIASEQLEHVGGLKRLVRSVSLISIGVAAYLLSSGKNLTAGYVFIGVAIALILFCSLIEYYQCLFIHFIAFTACSKNGKRTATFDEVVSCLSTPSVSVDGKRESPNQAIHMDSLQA